MNTEFSKQIPEFFQTALERKLYQQPQLIAFGQLHLQTQGSSTGNADANGQKDKPAKGSDRRIKENVVRVGNHPLGIGFYLYDYLPEFRDTWGHGRQFGVMADEVEAVLPEAVSTHADGYRMVDYSLLGYTRSVH